MIEKALILGVADLVSFAFGLVILYGVLFENKSKTKRSRAFVLSLCVMELTILCDGGSWLLEGKQGMDGFLFFLNEAAILGPLGILILFSFYELETIRERRKTVSGVYVLPIVIADSCLIAGCLIASFFGKIFSVTNGVFMEETGYYLCAYASGLSLIYLMIFTGRFREDLGKHDATAFFAYYLIPLITVPIELIPPYLELALVASSLSMMVVYIMLQSSQVSEMRIREQLYQEFSYTDILTGAKNRRSYENVLSTLFGGKEICAVFCDVNGLKYTNDNFGHAAGDALLLRFTEVMKKHLPEECCYRISGDEFVALLIDKDRDEISRMTDALRAEVLELQDIASIGIAYGKTEDASSVITEAEKHMYLEKALFYVKHPEYDMRKNRNRNL